MLRPLLFLLLAALPLATLTGCDSDDDELTPDPVTTLTSIVSVTPTYSTLETALTTADLVDALAAEGEFTLFAPEDPAFTSLNTVTGGILDSLLAENNRDVLADLLTYHVVPGTVTAADLSDGQTLTTLQGAQLEVRQVGGDFFVEGARIVAADVPASNGVLHQIDKVLTGSLDVVGLASLTPGLTTLVQALSDAGLVTTLQEEGPFTVFAPGNTAFSAFGDLPEGDALADVLLYHVVPGTVYASDITDGLTATTAQGQSVTFAIVTDEGDPEDPEDDETVVQVDEAPIVATDFAVGNGVVHVIGGVLTPAE